MAASGSPVSSQASACAQVAKVEAYLKTARTEEPVKGRRVKEA